MYTVSKKSKLGMFIGWQVLNPDGTTTVYNDFREDEKHLAESKCDLLNALNGFPTSLDTISDKKDDATVIVEGEEIKVSDIELKFPLNSLVSATITKNGYFNDCYRGRIVGYAKNGRIKVKSWRGVRVHAAHNIYVLTEKK